MTKKEWQDLYNRLDDCHREFLMNYPTYQNGKNKAIRKAAEYKVDSAIDTATRILKQHWDVFGLLAGENATPFDRSIVWDEFRLPQWLGNDMGDLLRAMKEKINTLQE